MYFQTSEINTSRHLNHRPATAVANYIATQTHRARILVLAVLSSPREGDKKPGQFSGQHVVGQIRWSPDVSLKRVVEIKALEQSSQLIWGVRAPERANSRRDNQQFCVP